MKKPLIVIVFLLLTNLSFAQKLHGKWHWENKDLTAEIFFNENSYFIKTFIKGTNIKISEGFNYYLISGDTIIFSKKDFETNPIELKKYLIKQITDSKLELLDLTTGDIDHYENPDHKDYQLLKLHPNEFYFSGSLGCISEELRENYNNCLNFTSFSILFKLEEIEGLLGNPYDVINQNGVDYRIYLLDSDLDDPPYLVVSLNDDNKINILQLTGPMVNDAYAFSGIRLGDYFTLVEQQLGKPSGIQNLNEDTQLWSYDPFPISLEIKNNLVFSIKLTRY